MPVALLESTPRSFTMGPRLSILAVDDSAADREVLERRLHAAFPDGVEVTTAEDAEGALAAIAERSFDAAIVDYLLPDRDGLEVIDELIRLRPTLATILMTGQGSEIVAAQAIQRGARDYVVKRDLHPASLARTVGRAIEVTRLAAENTRVAEQLRRAHEELDHFVRALSHDMSVNFMLLEHAFDHVQRACPASSPAGITLGLTHCEAALRGSRRFLDDLLALARTGSVQMEPTEVEVRRVVDEVLFEQHELLAERRFAVTVADDLPVVYCNESRLKQILTNLIRNAARYGGVRERPEITITAGRRATRGSPGMVPVRIYDNGPGIPARFREEIFLPGRRVPGNELAGSGMGLAIVKKIVDHYGGRVFIEPHTPNGTAFVFTLPQSPRHADDAS